MLAFLLSICDEKYHDKLEHLFYTYHDKMLQFARNRLRKFGRYDCLQDVEDIVQESFANILKYIHRINFDAELAVLECYILKIVGNEVLKHLKLKNKCPQKYIEDIEELIYDSSAEIDFERIETKEEYNAVLAELKAMDEKYSTPLLMQYCVDLSAQEIADVLGIPLKTVYTRLERGMSKVKQAMKVEDSDESSRK